MLFYGVEFNFGTPPVIALYVVLIPVVLSGWVAIDCTLKRHFLSGLDYRVGCSIQPDSFGSICKKSTEREEAIRHMPWRFDRSNNNLLDAELNFDLASSVLSTQAGSSWFLCMTWRCHNLILGLSAVASLNFASLSAFAHPKFFYSFIVFFFCPNFGYAARTPNWSMV